METKKKNVRSTTRQIRMMVDYMSTNPVFANGDYYGPLGSRSHEEEWRNLKALLAEDGPDKTVDQWKQTWKDIKKKARHENAASVLASSQTGNTVPIPIVSDTTTKVLSTIGMECSVGIGPAESSIGSSNQSFEIPAPELEYIIEVDQCESAVASTPFTSTASTAPRARRRRHARTLPAPSLALEFASLQKENNSLLKNIIKLMAEKNSILKEQNMILQGRYPSPSQE